MPPRRIRVHLTFDGPFNIGAGALGGSLADKPLTRDARGLPMVPGSAFKGRLRHEVERLAPHLFPASRPPCGSPVAETMCQGADEPCPVCRLFGSPWLAGKLTVSDLTLLEPDFLTRARDPVLGTLRYGVGISRQRKVAEDQLLYTAEVFLPGTPLTVAGLISGDLDDDELALVQAGLNSLFAVGGGKTRGLGWFELTHHIENEPVAAVPMKPAPTDASLELLVQVGSPLLLGNETSEAYYNTTRTYIPGSVLRGSLARQMLAACPHPAAAAHHDCDFGRLFGAERAPTFEHLYPVAAFGDYPFPAPLTARSCKYHPGFTRTARKEDQGHGVGDILIRQAIYEAMLDAGLALPVLYKPCCPACGQDVEAYDEMLAMAGAGAFDGIAVPVRRTSRTAIDRQRAVAADRQLYTLEVVEPLDQRRRMTIFRGQVRGTADQLQVLAAWLPRLNAIGRKQSSGLGAVSVTVSRQGEGGTALPALEERLAAFDDAIRQEWQFYQRVAGAAPLPADVNFFSLDLLSPAVLTWRNVPVTSPQPELLGLSDGITLQRGFAGYITLGGWHLNAGLPRRTQLAIAMGSVFLYRCAGHTLQQLAERLSALEERGIGSDRARGLGRVAVCLPFHYQAEVTL